MHGQYAKSAKVGSGCRSAVGTVYYKWVTVMDGIKFEFNNIIISLHYLYTKNDSDRGQPIILL